MIAVRPYRTSDAPAVGILIADTFADYNLTFASPDERRQFLGPFYHARSTDPEHRRAIAEAIQAKLVLVAERDGTIVGVLRGRADKLQSLFVDGRYHRQGIGRCLVEAFEQDCLRQGSTCIKLMSTLYAVPFYTRLGYRRSTGVRRTRMLDGSGFPYQPMKKVLSAVS